MQRQWEDLCKTMLNKFTLRKHAFKCAGNSCNGIHTAAEFVYELL